MQIFAFEVILELGNTDCGTRREIELSPPYSQVEVESATEGDKLDKIFNVRVSILFVNVYSY